MYIIWWLIIGAVIGWLAGQIMKGSGFGLVGNIIVGIVGAMIGGFISGALGIQPQTSLGSLAMAVVGACLLLFIIKLLRRA
jgi:uncharacterized membrane protein YeaQ/YmgE (transglycosylase-associated protein family)